MKNHSFIHIVFFIAFLVLVELLSGANTVSALNLIGPPRSILKPEQNSLSVEISYSNMDLEAYGEVGQTIYGTPQAERYGKYEIENMKSLTPSVRLDTNIFENWDAFLRVGLTDAAGDISEEQAGGATGTEFDDYDSDYGFSFGIGTRTTFFEQENTTWGASFQANWMNPGDSDITDKSDTNFSGTAELDYMEIQVAFGPTVQFENVRVYGGPFLHFVKGNLDIAGVTSDGIGTMTLDISSDIREKSQLGGFLGAQWRLGDSSTLITETQFTGDALGASVSMSWKF